MSWVRIVYVSIGLKVYFVTHYELK